MWVNAVYIMSAQQIKFGNPIDIGKNLHEKKQEEEIYEIKDSSKCIDNNICKIGLVPAIEKAKPCDLCNNVKEGGTQKEHSAKDDHVIKDCTDKNFVLKSSSIDIPNIKNLDKDLVKKAQTKKDVKEFIL